MITDFSMEDKSNYKDLRNNLTSYKNIFHTFSYIFHCSTEKRGFDLKSNFHIIFKTYKDKKQLDGSLGKKPENYENIHNETNIYKQKPINVDDFNEVKKRKQKGDR